MAEMSMMVAIETKYAGPGNVRGSRIIVTCAPDRPRMTVGWNHSLNPDANHATAAQAYADKMGWAGRLVGGSTARGYAFVFADDARRQEG